jgi:hypothetical protein
VYFEEFVFRVSDEATNPVPDMFLGCIKNEGDPNDSNAINKLRFVIQMSNSGPMNEYVGTFAGAQFNCKTIAIRSVTLSMVVLYRIT